MQVKNKVFCWDVPSRVHTYQVLNFGFDSQIPKTKEKKGKKPR